MLHELERRLRAVRLELRDRAADRQIVEAAHRAEEVGAVATGLLGLDVIARARIVGILNWYDAVHAPPRRDRGHRAAGSAPNRPVTCCPGLAL